MELSEAHSQEAVRATTIAQEAIEKARTVQLDTAIADGLDKYFNRGVQERKFVDIARIPFICDDIRGIHAKMDKISNDFVWVKWLVMSLLTGLGTIVIGFTIKVLTL